MPSRWVLNMCWECRELFKSLDTDASNTIEAKELADGLKAQGYSISQQELAQLMGRVDFDRNGTLDLEEFISGLIDWTEVMLTVFGLLDMCCGQGDNWLHATVNMQQSNMQQSAHNMQQSTSAVNAQHATVAKLHSPTVMHAVAKGRRLGESSGCSLCQAGQQR